jgi:two-component system, chemotaxis family, chemotaxis protein CheY
MANRVLIVDDQLISRMMIKDVASEAGWEIVGEATDGEEAISRYQDLAPDLVTMDMVMPNLDGLAALEKILDIDPGAKIVMVSAVDQKPKLARAIELGATDFIVKPVDRDRLLGMFTKMLIEET